MAQAVFLEHLKRRGNKENDVKVTKDKSASNQKYSIAQMIVSANLPLCVKWLTYTALKKHPCKMCMFTAQSPLIKKFF